MKMMKIKNENKRGKYKIKMKRGQVTMFIIAGLLIIAIIALFFFLRKDILPYTPKKVATDPESFLDLCLEENLTETLRIISSQGGYVENKLNIIYDGEKVSYLCYNQNSYVRCISQEPLLIQHLKEEIHKSLESDVERCFDELKKSLEKQNFEVSMESPEFEAELVSERVLLKIKNNIELKKAGETSNLKEFQVIKKSKFFDLALIVQEILSQESWYCNFEQNGFMLLYPQYDIEKFRTGDSSIVYTVTDKKTEEFFRFAIRGCAIPPGIG